MACSGYMHVENQLQANDMRKDIHTHTYARVGVHESPWYLHQLNISILLANSKYFCYIEIRRDVVVMG